jgi:F-type H+-transporting ATPase subunit epsilon
MALDVHVVTPEREVWTGEGSMVVARGVEGDVGILPGHAPLLMSLAIGPMYIHQDAGVVGVAVDGGFLHVTGTTTDSRVDVLAEHAELQTEIDVDAARTLQADAERRIAERATDQARADLERAVARIRVSQGR